MQIRQLGIADAAAGFDLTQQCGWPHRQEDWQCLLTLGEGYAMEQAGNLIGTALAWRWDNRQASIGVVVVDQAYQGQGIGKQLMSALIADLPGYNLRLHATRAGAPLYQKLGFTPRGQLYQYQTPCLPKIEAPVLLPGYHVTLATTADQPLLEALEYRATAMARSAIYRYLLAEQQVFILTDNRGQLVGSVGCHRYGRGISLGPCYVTEASLIPMLLQSVFAKLHGKFVRLDIDSQRLTDSWLTQWQFTRVDDPLIMVRAAAGSEPALTAIAVTVMSPALG